MIDDIVGIKLGIKLINGKLKPKYSKGNIIGIVIMFLLFVFSSLGLIYSIFTFNTYIMIMCFCFTFGIGYMLLISPYTQNSNNYYIEFLSQDSLNNFKLFYKNKEVEIKYIIDKEGKFSFADNYNKLDCISYKNKSKMSNLVKYKIINYFAKWLNDNNLMSSEITITFEKL